MSTMEQGLAILHVLRAPVGGLFRHVVDLAGAQAARGHRVGVVADATSGGAAAEAALAKLSPALALGLSRVAMSRHIGIRDLGAVAHVTARACGIDVLHGHGAKGGAYARLAVLTPAGQRRAIRVYTPHGGSLHYDWSSPTGFLYLTLERALMQRTDLLLFESAYGGDAFRAKIGNPGARARVVHNGITAAEFATVTPARQAGDLVFVGELRALKGVDVLLDAIGLMARRGRSLSAVIVGDGPDRAAFEAQARQQQLAVRFAGALPARAAFGLGRVLVVPSRAESLPYVVLEAAAAGLPLVATRVGGIPEIFGPDAGVLVAAGDAAALAAGIAQALDPTAQERNAELRTRLRARVRTGFTVAAMTEAVLSHYRDCLERPRNA
jgi:glycosyltransferase involved in cell wall biosynthesis